VRPDQKDRPVTPATPAGRRAEGAGVRPRGAGAGPSGLRDAWRRRSVASGWLTPDDWHSEAVDAVLAACQPGWLSPGQAGAAGRPDVAGRFGVARRAAASGQAVAAGGGGLAAACTGLGRSRAQAGTGIAETIDDLAALFAVLEETLPVRLVCAVAQGWAEESHAQLARDGCEDPLSGLVTLPYLRTRLAELYRDAEQGGTSPADTHRLLMVRLPRRPDPWHRMTLAIGVGRDLRAAFPGGETLSMARRHEGHGTGPAIALVPARGDLPLRYARLRRRVQATFGTQIRMTPLPGRLTEALRLVDKLAR
jgi:hypothetical protein